MNLNEYISLNLNWSDTISLFPDPDLGVKFSLTPNHLGANLHPSFEGYINKVKFYKHKDPYVASIYNLTIQSHNLSGSVTAIKDSIKFNDISSSYEFNNQTFTTSEVKGLHVLLSLDSGSNYFHWLCQLLPRIKLLSDYDLNYSKINGILIPHISDNIISESFSKLKVPQKLCINQKQSHIYNFKQMIVPSRPNRHIYFTQWSLDFLKSTFLKKDYKQNLKLYIFRDPKYGRSIINNNEVWHFLKKMGYIKVDPDGISISKQAKLFNKASHVIGSHGASLANLSFCQPNTKVIEFFNQNYITPLYWNLCNILKLKYGYLISRNKDINQSTNKRKNLYIDIDSLKEIINKLD